MMKVYSQTTQVADRLKNPEVIYSMKSLNKTLIICLGSCGLSLETTDLVTSEGLREGMREGASDRSVAENYNIVSTIWRYNSLSSLLRN